MSFSSQIKNIRFEKKLSQAHVAALLGVAKSTYSLYESGKREPDIKKIKLLAQILNVSTDTLFELSSFSDEETDIIEKYRSLNEKSKSSVKNFLNHEYSFSSGKVRYIIPYCDLPASAGTGQFWDSSSYSEYELPYAPPENANILVRVSGNSMEPMFFDGDKLFVQRQTSLNYGEIGLFAIGSDVFVKEYTPEGLKSINPDYSLIKNKNIICLGKVLDKLKG